MFIKGLSHIFVKAVATAKKEVITMEGYCNGGMCNKCKGGFKLVLGLLVLANVYYLNWSWWTFLGTILVLGGIAKMVKPCCPHCDCNMSMKKKR